MRYPLKLNPEWKRALGKLGYSNNHNSLGRSSFSFVRQFEVSEPFPRFHLLVDLLNAFEGQYIAFMLHVDWYRSNHDGGHAPPDRKPSTDYGRTVRDELKRVNQVFKR